MSFDDEEFSEAGRDTVYYVRAIQEKAPAINGGNLRCTYDEQGRCVAVSPCYFDYRTDPSDDCLAEVEPRAWSSPIFVNFSHLTRTTAGYGPSPLR